MMAQPLSFAFAMEAAAPRAKGAAAAWLNMTCWLGLTLATPLGGTLIAQANYALPLHLSGLAMGLGGRCNHLFFHSTERRMRRALGSGR